MIQHGLAVGIGSWIDRQQNTTGSPVFPSVAIPFELHHFGDITNFEALNRAGELAILANRTNHEGAVYNTGVPRYLWEQHQHIIASMITATSVLTPEARQSLNKADAVLFEPDTITISERYTLYRECLQIYQDLQIQGASPEVVQAAYQDLLTIGHKQVIEEALAIKTSLNQSTSILTAAADVSRINLALDSLGGDTRFVPTFFTPMSTMSTEHWTEAEVDYKALEDTLRPEVSQATWRQFLGNKSGKVHFRFASVQLIRPWFSETIYQADDWRLADTNAIIASGNGQQGELPSYISHLYLMQIIEITSSPKTKPTKPTRPHSSWERMQIQRQQRLRQQRRERHGMLIQPVAALATTSPNSPVRLMALPSRSINPGESRHAAINPRTKGINKRTALTPQGHRLVKPVNTLKFSRLNRIPHIKTGLQGRISMVQKITAATAASKLRFTQAALAQQATATQTQPSPTDHPTYLVGFGRTNLPACPNSNPNYQWP